MKNNFLQAEENHYLKFLNEIKVAIDSSRLKAIRDVNKQLISLYWNIGKMIVERQERFGWGKSVVERLAGDLHYVYPDIKGFSSRNIWDMRRFYVEYKDHQFLRQAVAEIPWGHNLLILNKTRLIQEREYYVVASARMGWTRNVLLNQIKANAYERQKLLPKAHNFTKALPVHLAEQADEVIKSEYSLEFLGINKPVLERELERRLIEKMKSFLLELGYGFSFVGSQYCLKLGANEYYVDLLFFNRPLKCLVAVELKTGKFEPEYSGKMDFYLHLLDEQARLRDENPSVGIILCAEKDNIVVEYALRSVKKPVGIAEYYLTKKLPKRFKGKLPEAKILIESIRQELK